MHSGKRSADPASADPQTARSSGELLSPGERALWFLHRLAPGSAAYNLAGAVRIDLLDPAALRRAVVRLVERHAALRTTFPAENGEPQRRVHGWLEPEIVDEDATGVPCGALRRRFEAEALRPFDPERGPLLRVRIFQWGGGGAALFVFHHLIADFWSLTIVLRELGELYGEETGSAPAELLPPPAAYEQWVERKALELSGPRGQALRAFWLERLTGPVPVLDLPADRPRPLVPSGAGVGGSGRLDAEVTARLQTLGRQRGATLFAAALAGFQLLLHRITGDEEVWVGVPAAGRGLSRWARTVGYFVNPVVLRGHPGETASFVDLLDAARAESEEALAHRDWPFPWLAEELHPVRDAGRTPLFQAMMVLYRTRYPEEEPLAHLALGEGGGKARLGGLDLETLPLDRRGAQLAVSLTAAVVAGELRFRLELDADRFDTATAQRFAGSFEILLAGGVADPAWPLAELPVLGEAQRHQVLAEWGEGAPPRSAELPVHELIRRQSWIAPDEPAVLFEGRTALTWRELRRRSLRLARSLRALGAGPGAVVGISLGRSPDLVVAVLGALETGAAYLPLDPGYPEEYLAYVVEDSAVSIILSEDSPLPLPEPGEEPEPLAGPPLPLEAWAYVLYTSGSTGKPKGTPVSHRALLNYLDWVLEEPLAGTDGVLFLTSLNFDASLKQLFGPLLRGRPVRLLGDESARRPERLLGHLHGASLSLAGGNQLALNCVPSLWRAVLELLESGSGPAPERASALSRLLLGGEGFDRELVERTLRLLPGLEIWNLYGPTEATANASAARLTPEDPYPLGIGRPIRGACLHVLDRLFHPVPPGTAGELAIGGLGVAPGYWNRPELTAGRFVPDPFATTLGGRLFRTGDLARWRPDGSLELLGRVDRQLKIRGLRIEPGEVEAALLAHPWVAECVVGSDPTGARLVAWVVPRSGAALVSAELRRHLEALLPASLVPSAFVLLGAMPRLPNGKVSHAALPPPEAQAPRTASAVPRTQAEEVLTWLWCETLSVPAIGIHDDFFERGGHSLLASRLLARVRTVFGVDLPLRTLFAAPTIARLGEAIAAVRRERRDEEGAVEPLPRDQPLPVSFAQRRLWVLHQLNPGLTAYHLPAALRLRGRLDVGALERALGEIVRRHESLRTSFRLGPEGPDRDSEPVQVIAPAGATALPAVDLAALPGGLRETEARRIGAAAAARPFDLESGPLLRLLLLRLGDEEHVVLLVVHHLVSDGWSTAIFLRELSVLYAAFLEGQPSPLPEPELQYADWALWQRESLRGEALEAQIRWWRERLESAPRVLDLPTDFPRPPVETYAGATVPVRLPPALMARARRLGWSEGATLFMVLLAAFQALLSRLSGQETVCVGTHVAGRSREEVEDLIGFFVNTLVIRTDLDERGRGLTGRALIARVRESVLGAFAYQDLPFERLVEALNPARNLGWSPLFQAAFTLQNVPREGLRLPGLEAETLELGASTAHYDLSLMMEENGAGITGSLWYRTALFVEPTIRRLVGHFETLLTALVEEPAVRVSTLPLLTRAESHQILTEWSGPERSERGPSLSELFSRQAARTPEATAVVLAEASITYGELDRRSNQLARWLRRQGAGPETAVAISLERSVEMVVGLLGILKSGAAYLPVDPLNPREWQAFLLEDAGTPILLTQERWAADLQAPGRRVLLLDSPLIDPEDDGPVPPLAGPENIMALLYTSGSTGRPKATVLEGRGLRNLCLWFRDVCPIGPHTRSLLGFSFSFDAAFKNILVPLLVGGRTVLPPPGPFDAGEMLEAIRREGVTFLNTTPSQMVLILQRAAVEGWESLETLETLILGGEAAPWAELRPWLESGRCRAEILHMYGPSEVSDTVSCHRATWEEIARADRLPVGRAADNTQMRVVDAGFGLLPAGVPGELCLAGVGVARGYLARPELTGEKMIPDPWGDGGRMYRTGDLARWRPDGSLEILGRIDHQLKIRGIRVEPAEVEVALLAHPAVGGAVVGAREGAAGEKRLIAWVVPAQGAVLPPAALLRDHLRERLPDVMVPAAVVPLEAFPVTPRGKIDRNALPDPAAAPLRPGRQGGGDPAEELMAGLWADVLGLEEGNNREGIGRDDDFFALGGHSLLATRLAARVRAAFGVDLPVRKLFEHPTVAALTGEVRRLARHGLPAVPPPRPRSHGAVAPLSLAQRRLWVLHQLTPGLTAYHLSAGIRLRGGLDRAALEQALGEIVRRHEALRTSFQSRDGEPVQVIAPAAGVHLPGVDVSALPEERQETVERELGAAWASRPFDLERGPLLRLLLLRRSGAEHVLFLVVHHLVSDGWSTAIFLRELSVLYTAFGRGLPSPLPEPVLQYADWALWQREHLYGEALEAQLRWWRERLESAPRALELPTDFPYPPVETHAGTAVPVRLPGTLVASVRRLGRAEGATLFMVLLAAWQALLGRLSGQATVSTGTHVAGRNRLESEELIGFFVNTLVIRTDLEDPRGSLSGRALVARVREGVLGAFAHQDLPFEKLVEALNPVRDLRRSPLFQAAFTLQNLPHEDLRLPGLEAEPLEVGSDMAQYELALTLSEVGPEVAGGLRYNTALFRAPTIHRLAGQLERLLAGLVEAPEAPVSTLPLLTAAESQQILEEWTGPERGLPTEGLTELFARQAARNPEAVAVVLSEASITYGELDHRSTQLAHRLRRSGAGPERVVAISVERSLEMVVGLLGILKSGAAYLPIDPLNPRERQAFLLEDGGASILLTQERWAGDFQAPGREVICLDAGEGEPAAPGPSPPGPLSHTHSHPPGRGGTGVGHGNVIAYLYTSGSTGRPKATVLEERGLLNLCLWYIRVAPIAAHSRSLLGLSFSFDAAFKNLLGPLLAGGQVVLPPPGPFDAGEMLAAIRRHGVTFLCTTPGQFGPILQRAALEGWESLETLETLILTGEAARWAELRPWLLSGRCGAEILNMYGPSEASDTVSVHRATREEILAADRLPVGTPADNTRLLVVDTALQPLPVGVPGELCLAGIGVARGYHARPGLTAEKFVPGAWGRGERMYRTGDLARWRPDGSVEVLGRIDHQVKIRGVRVEPPEVEASLAAHPAVGGAVVGAREDAVGGQRLIAWIVPAPGALLPAAGALRDFLRERLPDAMIPAAFVPLDVLPVTPRGKIDRSALPDPEERLERAGEALRDLAEELMASLWADLLGREGIGRGDDFFALGGHSLLATRLITRVRIAFGVDLPVRRLFENPTLGALTGVVRELSRHGLPAMPPPRPRPAGAVVPLSFAQRRLWVLHQLTPGLTAYHLPAALRLRGRLDAAALERALGEIVRRHEALRTSFPLVEGEPVQVVALAAGLHLPGVDLSALTQDRRENEVLRVAQAAARHPFDLEHGPLLRLALLRLDPEEHILVLVVHHLVFDGWSTAVFLRELSALYGSFLRGLPSVLPKPTLQPGDWALWQREHLRGEVLEAHLLWWRDRLESAPRVLDLPTDFPRPAEEAQAGASVPVELPAALTAALRGLGQAEGATLFMVLLAAFQVLLSRWSGEETVCTGTHVAGRSRLESEDLIGFFVNTLVIRTDLDGDPSGRELIARVREMVLGAFAHQDLPFEKLVEALQPPRQPGVPPLYQVALTLQNAPREPLHLPGLEVDLIPVETGTTQLDLSLVLIEGVGGVTGEIRYRTALFAEPTVRRLVRHYESLLAALTKEPGRSSLELPVLSAEERAQVMGEWSGLASSPPAFADATFPALFEAQVDRTPDAPAVVLAGRTLTYRELDRKANRVAHWLRSHGKGPETRVALRLERSPEMLAALLGVWKAGGAYVPIDAATPPERLAFLREDAAAALELTGGDVERLELAGEDDGRLGLTVAPEQLAYVIYTSGSTGQPKGVMVSHGSLMAFSRGLGEMIRGGGEGRRFALNASLAFDASLQFFLPLLTGASVWIVPEEARLDAEHMADFFRAADLDGIDCTPSQLELILDAMDACGRPPRLVLVGGEPIPPALWRRMTGRSGTRFWNVYGPTECTINVTAGQVEGNRPNLGHPWPGARVWLAEPSGLPAPAGTRAEIWIGGPQVARGYLGRPALTADRFRPDPFSGEAGARLYRTGDLARWLPDGRLDLLGRSDQQVKLRGHRIEPGEIEAQLLTHPLVREAAAGLRADGSGSPRLVAWIVLTEGLAGETDPRELRRWLGERLPAALVPSAFVMLDSLPRTTSGKLDRRALPAPSRAESAIEPPGPSGDRIERKLRELFREVLEVDRVDPSDSLFELGGHSMTAFRLATRIREAFGVRLAVSRLFTDPTPAALAEVIRELEREGSGLHPPAPVHRVPRDGPLPLSIAQQRLWVLHQITPGLTAYHLPAALRLRGRLNRGALERALGEIIRRHEALRTSFQDRDGEPVQVIAPAAGIHLPGIDLAVLPEERREAEERELGAALARRPFDLERGPLLRLALLRLGSEEHTLLLVVHHLVSDGWSVAIFLRELSALYAAFACGLPSPLAEPRLQYADWALWQREHLHAEELDAQLRWWRERLESAPRTLDLPTDFPSPPVATHAGADVPVRLPETLVAAVRELGRAEGATLFMVLLAAFQALLARLAAEETVTTGTHVAGRDRLESEDLIGFFVNTLVIRTDLDGAASGRELLARVREGVLGAFAHQDLPFEKLVEAINPARGLAGSPLFQAAFTLQSTPREDLRLPGLEAEILDVETGVAQYDLSLVLAERGGEIAGGLRYRKDLFAEATVRRLVRSWETLLEGLVAEPGTPVEALALLTGAERRQVLETWSRSTDEVPRELCLHDLFARQAASTPEAVALISGDTEGETEITYRELDRRSALLAWRLHAAGAEPDVPVAVLLERSADMVVALLGILRAGAGYLPLDLGYPAERLAWMLEDSGARLVVTRGEHIPAPGVRTVRIDDLPADRNVEPPAVSVSPDHLAYIVYTSGSTGKPKGVAATHRAVARVVIDPGYVELGPQETILQLAPVPFDASTFEIWGALLNGGRLAIFPPGPVALHELAAALRRHRVTTLFLTTGLFHQMVDQMVDQMVGEEPEGLAGVRQLITGGDVISMARVRQALEALPGCRLIHAYGPTETTTFATCHSVTLADAARPRLTLGRPIARTGVWLLDAHREPVPPGVPGEIYLGGDGLARGYWHRPDLTAERFVPHPFAGELTVQGGERLYRTGDLARWLPDGTVEFLGRIDRQVKIRGFRVEPAEIEATLERHPGVAGVVVEPRDDGRGNKRLVAWVVAPPPQQQPTPTDHGLLAWCRDRLPAYLVPAAFVRLDTLPLDPNGKVDRRALPEPEWQGSGFVPPQTPEEEWVAEVWAEVLGAGQVGVEDDFFALGGHSLLAARLISRLRAVFGVDLPVRALFEHPTVGALAAEIGRLARAGVAALPPPRPRADRGPLAPLSFAQRRLWVLHQLEPGLIAYHIAAALRLRGRLERDVLARALGEIVRRHEALRTSFPIVAGEPFQSVAPAVPAKDAPLPGVDLAALPEDRREAEAGRLAESAARHPFDLEHGPLLRLLLLRLDAEEHVLVLVVHHLVFDGWSTAVFLHELSALYAAFLRGLPSPLPEPALQAGDWALWQREHLQGEALDAQLLWWRDRLESAPRVLDLPTDFPRPPGEAQAGASVPVRLPEALTAALRGLGQAEGATLFMVLLAAFQTLLSRWSSEETICAGTHVAGRSRLESEDLIGFFINTLVIRTDLDGDPSGRELIARVREMVLGAFAHQDLPFEKLVEALQPPRQPGVPPLYQVAFTLQNAPREQLRLPGLEVDFLAAETGTTQLDLSLVLSEAAGGVLGEIRYRTALFAEPTVHRLARQYESLLEALTKEPGRSILELPVLSAEERAQVMGEWSGLAVLPAFGDATFPALFEAQVDRTPDAPAVVLSGRTLTYRELDQKANRVAHWLRSTWLRSHGRGPETRVALRLERSPEMLAALLGVWKAGGAYVPIDAATPPERLAFLREDASAALELTGGDVERLELAGEDDGRLGLAVTPEQLAYVIYTSGSTGQPKGVMVSHGSLMAFSRGLGEMIHGGGEGLRFAINASLAFDASLQFFLPLLTGASVWIVPEEARHDADHMAGFLRAADLDGIDCTPSQLELILDAMDASGHPPRLVLVGGEPISPVLWRRMQSRSGTRFWNVYGPTECTINVTARQVEGERPDLGHPWPGARVWLLESSGLPAPAGARAEIWLGGSQVARGYLGHPGLTADRFRPDPFSGEAGARLYRTGDLARWLPDGHLDLLGRADQQVKLRGHRIELGEIEAQLLTHPLVREAAAGLRADSGGSPRLVAWIVLAEGLAGETDPRELRRWLGERLPGSMVPSAFVVLDRLPKTTSGKLDRRVLPAPSRAEAGSLIEPAGPSGDRIERKLRELFREVLEVDRVDPSDSLFELGGHSMTAFRLATRIREAFGVRLAVSRLFTDPTPAALAELIRGMERDSSGLAPVRHVPRDRPLPLSLAQQRLWVLHQITPGLTTYHIPAGLRLRGRLDVPALHGALTEILRRHEALRTRFPLLDGEPVQRIDPPVVAPFPVLDLGSLPMEEREAEARRIARAEALRPFDLERGPLLRLGLLHLGAEEHILLLVVHHLVSDGWSAALFLRELSALYEAGLRGEPSPLPEPRVQYADWAVWQREQLQGEALEAHLHWWTERLAGAPRVLELPTDRPRPPVEDPAGASMPLSLPKALVEALRQLALAEGGTLYMTLLAGFQALLARIAGQETVSVGTHVARRNRLEVEGLIGFFVNTVVIRTDVPEERTGRELVHQVRDSVFGAFAHQDLPFERLVEALGLERDPRWSPLFQVSFALQNAPHEEPRLPGLDVELLETGTDAGHFDLAATLTETADGGATGAFSYRTALFFASTIRRLAEQYEAFLEALAAQPDAPLSALSLLTTPERHQILVEWAGPERAYPEQGLPELFAEQAARTPDAVAVVCGADSMTYGDLDRRSSQLAGWLRTQSIGPESAVAISVERSLEMVVGLLGILKSGAAYLPIDPLNPRERQAFLLEDAGVPILLTQEKWADGFQAPGRRVVCLDGEGVPPLPGGSECGWERGPGGEGNIQALLYTSGSTGRPKATVLDARGLLNLCLWFRDVCPIGPSTRSLLGFSFSFDAAFKNILVPLLAGGRTVLPPPGPFDAGEMLEAIRRERITFLNTTPSQMVLILQRAAAEEWAGLESLETLILGGEAAPWPELRPWLASGRCRAEILHMYGPSEASDTVSCHRATHAEIAGIADSGRLPVGRAADNTRLVVVAAGFEPLPVGVPGELCLAGDGVARGYLGRPALTAEKFIPDPFHPGARMYRTGDLARWLADGSLEILGRIDHQVKIRGIRVEPAEVEAALMTHPAIGGAVVEGRDSTKGEKRLIAWIVPTPTTGSTAGSPDPAELREHLRTRLPEVMIPTAFVILPAFPVSPRGKIDRNALPDPGAKVEGRALLPPRDEIELRLAGLFQEVLGGDVGIHDSFFDRGGHSLAAVRLVGRIRETFDVPFRVADLFLAPTVEELARLLRKDRKPVVSRLVPLRPSGDRAPLFLLPPGGGSVFGYVELVRRLDPSRPVFGLQARGLEEGQEPLRDLGEMAEQYLEEIRRAQPSGPLHLAGWSFGGLLAFEVAQRLRARGDEIAALMLIDPTDPPDILGIAGGELALSGLIRELGIPLEGFELSPEEKALSPEDRLTLLYEKAREAGRLRPWDDLPELRRRFEVIRANAEAACTFRPGPYDGPLDLFEPTDRGASIAGNWRPLAKRTHVLPGTHYSLLLPPQVDALAAALRELLLSEPGPVRGGRIAP
jgi:amino acid adenylation domain-containing protein